MSQDTAPPVASVESVNPSLWPPEPPVAGSPAARSGKGIPIWLWAVIGAVIGTQLHRLPITLPELAWLPFLLALALTPWLHIVVHEAGHALAGTLFGQNVFALGVGRWRLERGQKRWHWRRGTAVKGISGFAILIPRAGREPTRTDMVMYFLGGPLVNLLTAALIFVVVWIWKPALGPASAWLGAGCAALILGVINLVPFRSAGWYSDGMSLLHLLQGKTAARLRLQTARLQGLAFMGVRPRDWPQAWLPEADSGNGDEADRLLFLVGDLLHMLWAIDTRQAPLALAIAAKTAGQLHVVPAALRPTLAVNLAICIARFQPDPALLAAWMPIVEGPSLLDLSAQQALLRAEHAFLMGDLDRVRTELQQTREKFNRIHDATSALLVRERIEELEEAVAAASAQAPGT